MKRIRLVVAFPFVLGIFIGTMITAFLMLAVRSIDEEAPVQSTDKNSMKQKEEVRELPEEIREEKQTVSPAKLLSYNVLSSNGMVKTKCLSIHHTWGGEKAMKERIDFYIYPSADKEELEFSESRKMSVISLQTEDEGMMRRTREDDQGVFHVWKNICSQKLQHFLWFVKTRDNVYLRRRKLERILSSLNSSEPLFIGKAIFPNGKSREDLGLREGESFCHNSCYALSWKALEMLCPKLESCQENARSANEDVEVARCLQIHAGVNCTTANEMKQLFYSADTPIEQDELQAGEHIFNDKVKEAITLTPLTKPEHFYHLHHFYTKRLLQATSESNTKEKLHMIKIAELGAQSDSLLLTNENQSPLWTKLGINPPYKPLESGHDVVHFQALDMKYVYTESKHHPSYSISEIEWKDVNQIFTTIVDYQKAHGHIANASAVVLESVLKRFDPLRGVDYILQVLEKESEGFKNVKFLHSLRESLPVEVTSLRVADYKSTKVNFVVATTAVSREFQRFIMSFENSFLARKPPELVGMLVLMYSDGKFRTHDKDTFAVTTLVDIYKKKYPEADMRLNIINREYSRLDMLKMASKEYPSYELLFLSDIHIDFSTKFLETCRMNTIEDKQVYFPAIFNPYNPSDFYQAKILYPYATKFQISESRGSWMHDNFHIACVYNYDLIKILNGQEEKNWRENWSLVDQFIQQNQLDIFRSVEPGLVHMWQDGCKEVDHPGSEEHKLCSHVQSEKLK